MSNKKANASTRVISAVTLICAFISSLAAVPLGLKTFEEYKIMKIKDESQVLEFWRYPHALDGDFEFKYPLTEYLSGFHIGVSKSSEKICHGLQIISKRFPDIGPGNYVMRFEVNTNRPFNICSRLGVDNFDGRPNLFEHDWPIQTIESWITLSTADFSISSADVASGSNFLYFQVGKAPKGTEIKIRNIRFEKK